MEEVFKLNYKLEKNKRYIRLLGKNFLENNKSSKKGYFIYNNKKERIKEFFEIKTKKDDNLKITIKFEDIITDKSSMFEDCECLISVYHDIYIYIYDTITKKKVPITPFPDEDIISSSSFSDSTDIEDNKDEYENDNNLTGLFSENNNKSCSSFYNESPEDISMISPASSQGTELSVISYINYSKVKIYNLNLKNMFKNCKSLKYIKKFSILNKPIISDIHGMFYNCKVLKDIPDISKLDIKNVTDISGLFYECNLLKYLPDISQWNTENVNNMEDIFVNCSSLESLPDISNWNTSNVTNMNDLFYGCSS